MKSDNYLNNLPVSLKRVYRYLVSIKIPAKLVLIVISVLASAWFLIRVIPKPSRATYPCMQASAPFVASLFIWLTSISASWIAFRKAKQFILKAKYAVAIFLVFISAIVFIIPFSANPTRLRADVEPWYTPNIPLGLARGINPGRVAWGHNPHACVWNGTGSWYTDVNTIQAETDDLLNLTFKTLTGSSSTNEAWDALFNDFNNTKHDQNRGYQSGDKIAIKLNQNNAPSHDNTDKLNASPQLVLSLLKTLVSSGVPQADITVFDASKFITDNIYDKCHAVYPDVHFVDKEGGNGREAATYKTNAIKYSGNVSSEDKYGNSNPCSRDIANCLVNARYLINFALLKGHDGSGVTLNAKNMYGSLKLNRPWTLNSHSNFYQNQDGIPKYTPFVDWMTHKDIGEKTVLFLLDALYTSPVVGGKTIEKWDMAPFNNHWPSSLFASQDGIAIESVGIDFFITNWPDNVDLSHCDMHLAEAAEIGNAPSGTSYDPEGDGQNTTSLGVLEHWNNSTDKQYSRNLNPSTGKGIELVYALVSDVSGK
ncbi:DUF362 domain-containing protein [Bacteroidota bacterium]